MSIILQLFISMLKIGCFAFGGGYAIIALLENEFITKRKWIEHDEFMDVVAIAESTPGPIAINSATFIGYKISGVFGSFCATFGVVLPSFVIISIISLILRQFSDSLIVQYAFNGIRAGVLALLFTALFTMYKKCHKGVVSYIVMAASFLLTAFLDIPVLYVLISCAVFGLVTSFIASRRSKKL